MTSKSRARHGIRFHGNRRFSLKPTTHAIRHAIALGLVLAASSTAFAGGCDVTDPANAICEGFIHHTVGYSIDDLNLTVGGDFHTEIVPPGGFPGIALYAPNGTLTLTSAADIFTSHGAGIVVFAPNGAVNVDNSGFVSTTYADGIDAYSIRGDVHVGNDGTVLSAKGSNVAGIVAVTTYGNASIDNHGDVSASASNGYGNAAAYGVIVRGYSASLANDGSIEAHGSTVYGLGVAVGAHLAGYAATTINKGIVHGDFHADTGYAGAFGVRNASVGASTLYNGEGASISADASAGFGLARAYGAKLSGNAMSLTNKGSISASSHADKGAAYAHGSSASNYYGASAATRNDGEINASADVTAAYGTAISVGASTVGLYDASLVNNGDVSASAAADGDRGFARAIGAQTSANRASQDNRGSISATASVGYNGVVYAFGSYTSGKYGVSDSNEGTISASVSSNQGFANAHGLFDTSYRGDVVTSNTGDISATANAAGDAATTYGGFAYAYGTHSSGKYNTHVHNSGSIAAIANAPFGIAHAIGVGLEGDLGSTLVNDGAISATASASSYQSLAIGSEVNSRDDAITINDGSIHGTAYGDFGSATAFGSGTGTWGIHGVASLANHGDIGAIAEAYAGAAHATGANVLGIVAGATDNDGTISAAAYATHGLAVATGSRTYAFYNDATLVNTGSIVAHADAGDASATGRAYAYGSLVLGSENGKTYNGADGVISASAIASGDQSGHAFSVGSVTLGSYASLVNKGDIGATATTTGDSHASATGATVSGDFASYANSVSYFYSSTHNVDAYACNGGGVHAIANAEAGAADATGLRAVSDYGDVTVVNAGGIGATANVHGAGTTQATGVQASGYLSGPIVHNSGSISATADAGTGSANATGIASSFYSGDGLVQNDGAISAAASVHGGSYGSAIATGVSTPLAYGKYNAPTMALVNHGDISAIATSDAYVGYAAATGTDANVIQSTLGNYGSISAVARADGSFGNAAATGSSAFGKYGSDSVNRGGISASAFAGSGGSSAAKGLLGYSIYGGATLSNSGHIAAYAAAAFDGGYAGSARAMGVQLHGQYAADLDNSGSVSAAAVAAHGSAFAQGVSQQGKYAAVSLANSGDIAAVASADAGDASAIGAQVFSKYGASTVNDGSIRSEVHGDFGHAMATGSITQTPGAHGYFDGAGSPTLHNNGSIDAAAFAEGGVAVAIGSRVEGSVDAGALTWNAGGISASAHAGGGDASAMGAFTWSYYGDVTLANLGDISAYANGGDNGHAVATGSTTRAQGFGLPSYPAGHAELSNSGDLAATALTRSVGDSQANGAIVVGEHGVDVANDGSIAAHAAAGDGIATATGIDAFAIHGDATVTNAGDIIATASDAPGSTATAIHMDATGSTTLVNSGLIAAVSVADGSIAVRTGDSTDAIGNTGTLTGALVTGGGDDTLTNNVGGIWNVVGASTDFGAGDDTIVNAGTINLHGATIGLGSDQLGNFFTNSGLLAVQGGSRIDMGAANPNPFVNIGIIDFRNGTVGDSLTLAGDFSGNGTLGVDVSESHGAGDFLHVDGSVVGGSATVLDVNLLGRPTAAHSSVAVVDVTGDSTAGAFVLGDVHFDQDKSFLVVEAVSLTASIDATNTHPDVFSVGLAVTGLTDSGSLAASFAPGVQSLLGSEVGSWRERMGVIDGNSKGRASAWARGFQDSGRVNPGHVASNFGQGGHVAFDQDNSGQELGVDVGISDAFSAGVMLGKAQASQHLDSAASGRSRISGDTRGVYGTWLASSGFYLDASYRWMRFDARLDSAVGETRTHGKAGAFNVELGRDFTLGDGLKIQPQFQYTRATVDHIDMLSGALAGFKPAAGDSSRARVGVLLGRDFAASGSTVWTPYASVNAVREFDGRNAYTIDGNFSGATSTKGTSALVQGGLTVRTGKLSVFGGVNWQDGGALKGFVGGQIGLRYTW